jgi:hypothetical protein
MYELERLAQDIPFKVLNQLRDSVGVGPGFAPVVAGSQSVGVVCLIDKGAVGFERAVAWIYARKWRLAKNHTAQAVSNN